MIATGERYDNIMTNTHYVIYEISWLLADNFMLEYLRIFFYYQL